MLDVIRDAWPWLIPAFLLGLALGWLVTWLHYRDRGPARAAAVGATPGEMELAAGTRILGRKVRLDDLRLVEGVGPKIERLMNDEGIRTWRELADAPVRQLERILDAAGPHYNMHVPQTWPRQARLLVEGKWAEFRELTDELIGGR